MTLPASPAADALITAAEHLFGVRPDLLHLERTGTNQHLVALTAQGTPINPRMQAVADLTPHGTYHAEGTAVPLRDEAAYTDTLTRNPWLRDVLTDDLLRLSPAAGPLRLAVPDAGAVQVPLPSAALGIARHLSTAALNAPAGPFWAAVLTDALLRVFLRTVRPSTFEILRRAARGEPTGECEPLIPGMLQEVTAALTEELHALLPDRSLRAPLSSAAHLTQAWLLGLTTQEYENLHASNPLTDCISA